MIKKNIGGKWYLVTAIIITIPMVIYILKCIQEGFAGKTLLAAACWTIACVIWWALFLNSRIKDRKDSNHERHH
jgi:hypothetical protein